MSSPWGQVEDEFVLTLPPEPQDQASNLTWHDGSNNQSGAQVLQQAPGDYEFTFLSLATSVLLGVMTLTTIVGNLFKLLQGCKSARPVRKWAHFLKVASPSGSFSRPI